MPIRALSQGKEFTAPLLNDAEWESLRAQYRNRTVELTMPCCPAKCFPRVSKLGTRHFAHIGTRDCNWKPETPDHIAIKSVIAISCDKAGWLVKPEARRGESIALDSSPQHSHQTLAFEDDWRADVLTWAGNGADTKTKIAFEIQWSKQSLADTRERQAKYARDGVRCFWLFRALPDKLDNSCPQWAEETHSRDPHRLQLHYENMSCDRSHLLTEGLPMFRIHGDRIKGYSIKLGACLTEMPLADFVQRVLNGKIAFRHYIRVEHEYTDSMSESLYYKSACGRSAERREFVRPHKHWCLSDAQGFCPNKRSQFSTEDDFYWRSEGETSNPECDYPEPDGF